jgi:hypothetical protein
MWLGGRKVEDRVRRLDSFINTHLAEHSFTFHKMRLTTNASLGPVLSSLPSSHAGRQKLQQEQSKG